MCDQDGETMTSLSSSSAVPATFSFFSFTTGVYLPIAHM